MYFLGIDAGGTQCRARVADASGRVIGVGTAGPANARIGVSNVFSVLKDAYSQAIQSAGLDDKATSNMRAGIGIAGIGREGAIDELLSHPFPFTSIALTNDGIIANIGAHSGKDGGIVIVGTGSIGVGRVKGKDIYVGGYGFPASDEGSGAYIGLQAIRMTLHASDGRIPHSELTKSLFHKYGDQSQAVIGWMDTACATGYAALAPLVMQAAEKGDEVGRTIVQRAAHHIELMVHSLISSGAPRCALVGGLAEHIQPWLSPDVRAKLVAPEGDSLDGALRLARQEVNV